MKKIFEKSIVTSRSLKKGEKICKNDMAYKKPGDGISAALYKEVIGKTLKNDLAKNIKINWEDLM